MTTIAVGIQFHPGGKIYHFDASAHPDLKEGDYSIVETSRGQQLGRVITTITSHKRVQHRNWKPIIRKATPRDLVLRQIWEKKEEKILADCHEIIKENDLQGVKLVSAEFSLKGEQLVLLYSYEEKGNPNLRSIAKAMEEAYPHAEINLRRVGPRDAAKIIGGMGACGREIRCCTEFMTSFKPISIKKAKAQGVSLVPSEISGMCGRLRCCLDHEHQLYVDAKKKLPKYGSRVRTPLGRGKVVRLYPLQGTIRVDLKEKGYHEFVWEEIKEKQKK
ncbi:MAG: hypothetical protein MAG431_00861 [Chloroflexi bacterium]|nr:hypothetical protein [Chloroflexota bacterium]